MGLDLGSTTTKAVLIDIPATGEVIVRHVARRPSPTTSVALRDLAAEVVRECAQHASSPLAAVGVAAMGESGIALDAAGEPLTGILRWDARRDPTHLHALLRAHPELPAATGVPATTKPAAVVLTGLRAEQPEAFARMKHWAGAADLVVHTLTGIRITDHTLAARTMLSRDGGMTWDAGLLEDLGMSAGALPEVRPPGAEPARTSAASADFGLRPGVPVYVAGHDHVVGAWAAGVRRPDAVADSLGTAEAVVRVTDAVDVAAAVAAGFAVGRSVDGSARTIVGGTPACGSLLSWWEREHPADRLLEHLGSLTGGTWSAADTLVLPYPSGRQCPDPREDARLLVDAPPDATGKDRARGLLQSLVFQARWMRETADELAGARTRSITVIGSLAERIPAWAALTASAGIPTRRSDPVEAVAAGAALLAAVRAAAVSPAVVLPSAHVRPMPSDGIDGAYRRFVRAARAAGAAGAEPAPIDPREGEA